jgi:hypothetical protein
LIVVFRVTKATLLKTSKLESTVRAWKMYPVASGTGFHLKSIDVAPTATKLTLGPAGVGPGDKIGDPISISEASLWPFIDPQPLQL